nr:hypothetical protein [Planctomycetota bacterium]
MNLAIRLSCLFLVCARLVAADGASLLPTPEQLAEDLASNLRQPATYAQERSTWKAKIIAVDQTAPPPRTEDYATVHHGKPWDFADGTVQGIKGMLNVDGLRVEQGVLRYTTRENAEIHWGDHYGNNPAYGEEAIGGDWTSHWHPMNLRLRVRQSLPQSKWTVSMCQGQDAWMWRQISEFTLSGSEWQTVDVKIIDSRACFRSLSFLTPQAGNEIQIDSVSVWTPRTTREYRYQFDLAADAEAAALCVNAAPSFTLLINDAVVAREEGSKDMERSLRRFDGLAKRFRKGTNTITVQAELYDWSGTNDRLLLEGMVRDTAGVIHPFGADERWQARYLDADGKGQPWTAAKVVGPVTIGAGYYIQPPYYGRIEATHPGRKCPIFAVTEDIAYRLVVHGAGLEGAELAVEVRDALAGGAIVHERVLVAEVAAASAPLAFAWRAPKAGVYDVCLQLRGRGRGAVIDEHVIETAVVGPIAQPEIEGKDYKDGLELKLVEDIDCVDVDQAHPFISCASSGEPIASTVVDAPFGRYRAAAKSGYAYLSWRIKVAHPDRPHVMEIDYPDDATRIINVSVGSNVAVRANIPNDHGERCWNRVGSGVYTGFEHPPSGSMRTLRLLYWPGDPIGSVVIASAHPTPAAVARIRVFEITNDLPALRRPFPAQR